MIDEETGLPKLPEGYFWRVRHHRETAMNSYYGNPYIWEDKTRLQVQLVNAKKHTEVTSERKWFRTVEATRETTREVVLFTEDAQGTNPIAVRNTANRIMNLWIKAKERDALVGDYPPKKLEVGNG